MALSSGCGGLLSFLYVTRKKNGREKITIQHTACNKTITHFFPAKLNLIESKYLRNHLINGLFVYNCDKNIVCIDEISTRSKNRVLSKS